MNGSDFLFKSASLAGNLPPAAFNRSGEISNAGCGKPVSQGEASREFVRLHKILLEVRKFTEYGLPSIKCREVRAFAAGYLIEMMSLLNITEKRFRDPGDKKFVAETYLLLTMDLARLEKEFTRVRQLLNKCVTQSFIKTERSIYLTNYNLHNSCIESGKSALFSFEIYAFLTFTATCMVDTDNMFLFRGLTLFGLLIFLWILGFFFFARQIFRIGRHSGLIKDMVNSDLKNIVSFARSTGLIKKDLSTHGVIAALENYLLVLARDIEAESYPFTQFRGVYSSLSQIFGVQQKNSSAV